MRLRRIWVSLLAIACGGYLPQPKLGVLDCIARDDCVVVKVDNTSGLISYDIWINGRKYGDVTGYSTETFNIYRSQLVDGNCITVKAIPTNNAYASTLVSTEECVLTGQYFQISITNDQKVIWLVPTKISAARINDN